MGKRQKNKGTPRGNRSIGTAAATRRARTRVLSSIHSLLVAARPGLLAPWRRRDPTAVPAREAARVVRFLHRLSLGFSLEEGFRLAGIPALPEEEEEDEVRVCSPSTPTEHKEID